MKKILDVPYYSQHEDVKDEYWKKRSCAIVCLKMVINYYKKQDFNLPTIQDLIEEGVFIKGLDENKDWKQDSLVILLHNLGFNAYRQEFKSFKIDLEKKKEFLSEHSDRMLGDGINKITGKLSLNKPVLVSVAKKFKEESKFHMVVLTGFEMDGGGELKGFYYNDTDYRNEREGKDLFVDIETFKTYWRRLAIFVK